MKKKNIILTNIIMLIFCAVNIKLLIYPLGLVYVIGMAFYEYAAAVILPVMMIFFGIVVFLNKEHKDKEGLYIGFSVMIWVLLINPGIIYYIIYFTDIWWMPSV